jgi:predicted nucleic acid-binding protein
LIVVDTNVVSELMRPEPHARVVAWLRNNAAMIAVPSVVIGELRYGVARLPAGRRKSSLAAALDALVERFSGSLIAYDVLAANACGAMLAAAEAAGRPMNLADAQIAACAQIARAALATRNVADFATTGLKIIDPWSS